MYVLALLIWASWFNVFCLFVCERHWNTRLHTFFRFFFFCISLNYTWKCLLISHFTEKVKLKLLKYLQCLEGGILFREITKKWIAYNFTHWMFYSPKPYSCNTTVGTKNLIIWEDFISYSFFFSRNANSPHLNIILRALRICI